MNTVLLLLAEHTDMRLGSRLMPEQGFYIAASVRHAQNKHVAVLDAIHDDVFANRETSWAGTKIIVAAAAQVRMAGEKKKSVG